MFMKKNEKLRIEEDGNYNYAILKVRLHIDESHAKELREKVERRYDSDGIGELFKRRSSFLERLIYAIQKEVKEPESGGYATSLKQVLPYTHIEDM